MGTNLMWPLWDAAIPCPTEINRTNDSILRICLYNQNVLKVEKTKRCASKTLVFEEHYMNTESNVHNRTGYALPKILQLNQALE